MLLIGSYLVYGLIISLMMYNASRVLNRRFIPKNTWDFITDRNYIVPIVLFALFASIRWRVGVDCNAYINAFYTYDEQWLMGKGELGYLFLIRFFRFFHASHVPFFFVLALLQISFVYFTFKKEPYVLLFFSLFLFMTGEYWSWMNGVRQIIACSVFIYATYLIANRKWLFAVMTILFASLFHRSAIILFPLAIIFSGTKIYIANRYLQLILVTVSLLFMGSSVTSDISVIIENVMNFIGYGDTQEHMTETIIEKNFGLRSILMLASNLIVIWYSPKLFGYYKSKHFNIMYNLYFIGVCLSLVFYGNHGIERFLMYFRCFTPIILSYCAYYFFKHRSEMSKLIGFVAIILFLFVRTSYEFYEATTRPSEECILYKTVIFNKVPKGTYDLELW